MEGFPLGSNGKESAWNAGDLDSTPGLGRSPGGGAWQPTAGFLPGESHGQRSLVDCSPWGWKELNTTGHLSAAQHSTTWVETKNPSHKTTRGWKLEVPWPWLLPLFESKNVSRGQKLKAGTKFIIRDTAQCMGVHTGKLTVCSLSNCVQFI